MDVRCAGGGKGGGEGRRGKGEERRGGAKAQNVQMSLTSAPSPEHADGQLRAHLGAARLDGDVEALAEAVLGDEGRGVVPDAVEGGGVVVVVGWWWWLVTADAAAAGRSGRQKLGGLDDEADVGANVGAGKVDAGGLDVEDDRLADAVGLGYGEGEEAEGSAAAVGWVRRSVSLRGGGV